MKGSAPSLSTATSGTCGIVHPSLSTILVRRLFLPCCLLATASWSFVARAPRPVTHNLLQQQHPTLAEHQQQHGRTNIPLHTATSIFSANGEARMDENSTTRIAADPVHELGSLFSDNDRKILREDIAKAIDKAVQDGIVDLTKLRDKQQRDILNDGSRTRLERLMTLNGIQEAKKFDAKVDTMVGSFLNATAGSREETHLLAYLDQLRIQKEEREKKDKEKKKTVGTQSWKKTNDAWDAWDDW